MHGVYALAEYVQITSLKTILRLPPEFFVWMGVVTSLCVALGMLLVKRIFNYIASTENQRRISERRILNTVLRTEEKERLRFSKDLHDGWGLCSRRPRCPFRRWRPIRPTSAAARFCETPAT